LPGREHEISDLDDPPLHVEAVDRAAADDLARLGMRGGERQQPTLLGHGRQVFDRVGELLATERRQVPRFAELGIGERGQNVVDVAERGETKDDLACAQPLGRHRESRRHLRHHRRTVHSVRNGSGRLDASTRICFTRDGGSLRGARPAP
jgi:hypothetical protein